MKVIAASEIHGPAGCSDKLLKAEVARFLEPPRRVDRLILQSLLGAAPFLPLLRKDCGLYLAADYPCRPTMELLLEAVFVQHKLPKPLEFVNSVSNAAGFHVAQKLGVEGPNLFIGAGRDLWRQFCELAALDMADGVISQALLIHSANPDAFVVRSLLLDNTPGQPDRSSFANLSAGLPVSRLEVVKAPA